MAGVAVSILLARTLIDAVEAAAIRREDFLSAAGFDAKRLDHLDGRLTLVEYDALILRALEATGDAALGLHVLNDPAIGISYNVTAHLVAHAGSLREAIETLTQYHRLISDRRYWVIDETRSSATIRYQGEEGPVAARRYRSEFTVTAMYKMVQYFVRSARPEVVAFDYPAPRYRGEYTAAFGGRERFEQAFTGIAIPREVLDETHQNSDLEFHSTIQLHAKKKLAQLEGTTTYADRVSAFVTENPARQDMQSVARALGVSTRSLRRRLSEEGTFYSAVVERALAALAERLLVDERSTIQDVAHRLSFSDASTFCRAFKRWTGSTPKQYIAVHATAGEGTPAHTLASRRPVP